MSGSNEWKILPVIRPGDNPLYSLAEAFTGKDSKKMLIQLLQKELRDNGADKLQDLIAEDIEKYSRVVLVVDQFEEVFTLCLDIKARQQFFDCLLGAVESSNNKLCLVITIRADFVGECAAYPKLAKQIQQDLVTVTPMTTEELTEAIKEPASQVGLGVEETLVIQMIADVQKSSGSLPLLQFTLMELWEKRNINTTGNTESNSQLLTLHAYQKMGGVMGALNRHAQQIYNYTDYKSASPSQERQPQEQELIRRIFLKLLRTGEGVKDTRQPQPKTKLMAIAGEDSQQQAVLSQLIEELIKWRLLVTSEVEISSGESSEHIQIIDLNHEALMSGWEEFAQWREKYRQILRLRDRVDDALRVWNANSKKNEDLIAEGLLRQIKENWSDLEQEFDATAKEFYQLSDKYEQEKTFVQTNLREALRRTKAELEALSRQKRELENRKAEFQAVLQRFESRMANSVRAAEWLKENRKIIVKQAVQEVLEHNRNLMPTLEFDKYSSLVQRLNQDISDYTGWLYESIKLGAIIPLEETDLTPTLPPNIYAAAFNFIKVQQVAKNLPSDVVEEIEGYLDVLINYFSAAASSEVVTD